MGTEWKEPRWQALSVVRTSALRRVAAFVGRHELSAVLTFAVAAGGALTFVKVAEEVGEGETRLLDRALLLALRNPHDLADPLGPVWLEEAGRDLTALGGGTVLLITTLSVLGYLLMTRKARAALFLACAVASSVLASMALKQLFQRPRPALVPHFSNVMTTSFPSGHSMLSAAVYLTLASMVARLHQSPFVKAYALGWGLLISGLVGISRVYVGVHWPTDVLAGWAAGSSWAAAAWLLARTLQRKGELEPPEPEVPGEPPPTSHTPSAPRSPVVLPPP